MTRRKTDAEFRAEVKALVGDEYTFLEPYKNNRTKIKVRHNKCGYVYEVRPAAFLKGERCPKCVYDKITKTNDEFKAEVKALVGNEYVVINKYVNSHVKLKFKHQICGTIFEMRPMSFLRGQRCPKCALKKASSKLRKDPQKFKQEFYSVARKEYILVSNYLKTNKKIVVLHLTCGSLYQVYPNNFLRGSKCPYCYGSQKLDDIAFKKRVHILGKRKYEPLQKYNNAHTKILMLHKTCGRKYYVRPNDFFRGHRCPYCKSSRGEQIVEEILNQRSICFQPQFKINDCRDKNPLPFDFAIFDKEGILNCLIEYQGAQHFVNPFKWRQKNGPFNLQSILDTQKHDAMKLQYCKDHNIQLIRINHPQTSVKSKSVKFIERLVNRTLDKELKVS